MNVLSIAPAPLVIGVGLVSLLMLGTAAFAGLVHLVSQVLVAYERYLSEGD